MSRILFFTWPGGGNQPPAIGLAQQLRRSGHETLFVGYAEQVARFADLQLELATLPRSGGPVEVLDPADLMPVLRQRIWACPEHVPDTAEVLRRYEPDLVVVDCLMGAVLAAMETSPIRTLALVHSAPGALAPIGGPLDALVMDQLNSIRSTLQLEPLNGCQQVWQQHRTLCASIPELDPVSTDTLLEAAWIGPVFEDVAPTDWTPDGRADTPLVLVSFSSGPAWDQTSRIQRTIDGLAGAGFRVVVTTGTVDPARLRVPSPAVTVVNQIPHGAVLPHATAVVTHGGHGTLTAALAHGLPVVAIPNLAADQPALAERTAELGAGIHLHDDEATSASIAQAVRTVIEDPTYSTSARALADTIRGYQDRQHGDVLTELRNATRTSSREPA
jgi:UDP:flavonoid glycosyltransferase YjiC (YdhE family)